MSNLLSMVQGGFLWGIFASLLIVSYLLYALFSWSFIKPCKYIGICSIIVGALLLIIRFASSFVVAALVSDIKIPGSLLGAIFKPFLIMGIIYILVGIGLIVLQHLYYTNKNKNQKPKSKNHK